MWQLLGRLRAVLSADENGKYGAFAGVFTPSVLTILGVIMFLRFPWVVGHAGLGGALIIVALAHLLTLPTALSVAAIATNRKVGGGGDYYMLSRSLGLEVGGAIGVALFFAQALSVSLYTLGFTEAFLDVFPGLPGPAVAVITTLLVAGLAFWDTTLALRSQFFIMALIVLALGSIFAGPLLGDGGTGAAGVAGAGEAAAAGGWGSITWWPRTVGGHAPEPFVAVFAVFFPAVTGFTQGVSMSGDLRDPRRSLPAGTFAAVGVGLLVYIALIVLAALVSDPADLRRLDTIVFKDLAAVGLLVTLGICGATLSSALGSVLGAPRILQALARDSVVPRFLERGSGTTNMPRLATVAALLVALAGVGLAYLSPSGLNAIASVITMFFLASYGFISLACGLATWSRTPSFRPTFRVPAWVSLAGAAGCFYMMSRIHLPAMLAAVVLVGLIYMGLARRHMTKTWGDLRHGLWAATIRRGLAALRDVGYHPLNWQPHVVVLGGSPLQRPHLLQVGYWAGGHRGLVTYFFLRTGDLEEVGSRVATWQASLQRHLSRDYPNLFTKVQVCERLFPDALTAVQAHGLPGFSPNTVVLGWSGDPQAIADYVHLLRGLVSLDKSILVVSHKEALGFGERRIIELWWGGLRQNGSLMMLLAALMKETEEWSEARVVVRMIGRPFQDAALLRRNLERILTDSHLEAEVDVIIPASNTGAGETDGDEALAPEHDPMEIIASRSRGDIVLLGLRPPEEGEEPDAFAARIEKLTDRLPTCVLIRASGDFEGAEMLFEKEWKPPRRGGPPVREVSEEPPEDL